MYWKEVSFLLGGRILGSGLKILSSQQQQEKEEEEEEEEEQEENPHNPQSPHSLF